MAPSRCCASTRSIEYSVWSNFKRADGWYAGGDSASGWRVMRFNLTQNAWAQKIAQL
ncbi:MAG: hypothetical protein IPI35_30375 [Deltaproteobacteria bacterium]|nr:hypothetical protein [Deltaproteobacteria bacterium]